MNLEQCEIKQLKQENEQLRAHVERLTSEAIRLGDIIGGQDRHILNRLLDETPAQSLQQIKRDAVLEAMQACSSDDMLIDNRQICSVWDLEDYANNLVKDGE